MTPLIIEGFYAQVPHGATIFQSVAEGIAQASKRGLPVWFVFQDVMLTVYPGSDAAKVIADYAAKRDALRSDTRAEALLPMKWIPVSERMPGRFKPCIVAFEMHPGYKPTVCQDTITWDGHRWCVGGVSDTPYNGVVSHWMYLPAAPETISPQLEPKP